MGKPGNNGGGTFVLEGSMTRFRLTTKKPSADSENGGATRITKNTCVKRLQNGSAHAGVETDWSDTVRRFSQ